jgi:Uma2 family endonuclease
VSTVDALQEIGLPSAGTLMTPEEFDSAELWDDAYVYELINGVLVVNPPPSAAERGLNELLGNLLFLYQTQHPQGAALNDTLTEHTIRTRHNRRRADRAIWAQLDHAPNVDTDPPTIAVEFVSVGRRNRARDYEVKRAEYLEIGLAEYWIIDRFRRRMTVVRLAGDEVSEIVLDEDQVYTTPRLPGFQLPLQPLLAKADRYEPPTS